MPRDSYRAAGSLHDCVIVLFAYDASGVCVAREEIAAFEAYTGEIDLIDQANCRRSLAIRRIVAEQHAHTNAQPEARWEMVYDDYGALTDAHEYNLVDHLDGKLNLLEVGWKLAGRLRWIGAPSAQSESSGSV